MNDIISFEQWRLENLCGFYEVLHRDGRKELKITAEPFIEVFIKEYGKGRMPTIVQVYELGTTLQEIYNDWDKVEKWWKELDKIE